MNRVPRSVETLSRLLFSGTTQNFEQPAESLSDVSVDVQYLADLSGAEWAEFIELSDSHHVTVRALTVLQEAAASEERPQLVERCATALAAEKARIQHAVGKLRKVCAALESHGCPHAVIKSLDHWPDLGSDLDLYVTAPDARVREIMQQELGAHPVDRSWGDRLAHKWNFQVADLPELVEIHVRYLGQTGEHKKLARRVISRRVTKTLDGLSFQVPAPEERVMISTLQRMYRHFYFRLCDMVDFARLLQARAVDFAELKEAGEESGIWPGVAAFLLLVVKYAQSYGRELPLPGEIRLSAPKSAMWFEKGFLRVSKLSAAGLYGAQLFNAGVNRDLRAVCRLPLLPPLAVSALLAYRLTGSDKGVW